MQANSPATKLIVGLVILASVVVGIVLIQKNNHKPAEQAVESTSQTPDRFHSAFDLLAEAALKNKTSVDVVISPDSSRGVLHQITDTGVELGLLDYVGGRVTSTMTIPNKTVGQMVTTFVPFSWALDNRVIVFKEVIVSCGDACDNFVQRYYALDVKTLERVSGNHSLDLVLIKNPLDNNELRLKFPQP